MHTQQRRDMSDIQGAGDILKHPQLQEQSLSGTVISHTVGAKACDMAAEIRCLCNADTSRAAGQSSLQPTAPDSEQ